MKPCFLTVLLLAAGALFLPPKGGSHVDARGDISRLPDPISWLPPVGGSVTLSAQDWSQWRGPSRNGTVTAAGTPTWPAGGQSWKRAWRVDVGEGYSSPVVSGGRAFVHSRRDPDEIVTAIDIA